MTRRKDTSRVKLQPADSFDLIRLIARSQSDPRKAVAELIQNSLDANATHIRITWFTHQGQRALSVFDDGAGVFPDRERREALRRIATTIGQSHKARLTPAERHRQMTLGKYGIGLLGFWSLGRFMEIRSRVEGSEVWVLEMEEEEREARVRRRRSTKLPLEPTMTEVVVSHIHAVAAKQIHPRRLAAYLAGELRGQLLERSVHLEIYDRVGRGRTQKRRVVRPARYRGVHLKELREFEVKGYAPARTDLYLIPESEDRRGRVALACGGSTVVDDLAALDGPDHPRAPWATARFEGVVDFPDLTVAPSSRRGFVPDKAAEAFLDALGDLERRLVEILGEDAERRRQEEEAEDAQDIRRVFRRLPRTLPDYAFFEVPGGRSSGDLTHIPEGEPVAEGTAEGAEVEVDDGGSAGEVEPPDTEYFYPPGPLAEVEIRPRKSVLALGGERKLRAVPRDEDGRLITDGVAFAWRIEGCGSLNAEGELALYRTSEEPGEARVFVTATMGDREALGEARVRVTETDLNLGGRTGGIPTPEPCPAPAESWRSRLVDGRWEYNTAHPDYLRIRDHRLRRLRYLVRLFAKELVLRNFGDPGDGRILERMVQVLTYVEETPGRR